MRFAALFLLAFPACAQTFVSLATYELASNTNTGTATFSGGVTSGNLVACSVQYGNSGNPSLVLTVSGTGGDTFTQAGSNSEVTTASWGALYYRSNATGNASYAVTASWSPVGYSNYVGIVCGQYSGAATTAALDKTALGINNSSSGIYPYNFCTTSAFTTTSAKEVIIMGASGGPTYAANSPLTLRGVSGSSALASLSDATVTTIQTGATETVTGGSYNSWNCNLATFIKAASAPTGSQPFIF
jgi:hypothetical protein